MSNQTPSAPHDLLGVHVSIAGGVDLAPRRARLLGCSAMQIFMKGNRQWRDRPISDEAARAFRAALRACEIDAAFAHSIYLINLATPKPDVAEKSLRALVDEIERCELLGLPGVVLHPGAHMERSPKEGIAAIAKNLRAALKQTRGCRAAVWLETVAGQGTTLGRTFEELAEIAKRTDDADRLGFCLDTCHVFAAGYDIRTAAGWEEAMAAWDRLIGLGRLRAIHLNDSKHPLDSRRDRHEHIGRGALGLGAFHALLNDSRLARVPKVLETPKRADAHEDRQNLRVLRRLVGADTAPRRRPAWKTPPEIDPRWVERLRRGE